MFQRMRERLARFMIGRYGVDDLGKTMVYGSLAVMVVNLFLRSSLLYWLTLIVLVLAYFRMFSRNTAKRYRENLRFQDLKIRIKGMFRGRGGKSRTAQDPTKKIFKCPGCRQKVRVPKGKGTILITCPKCGAQFQRRT